MNGKRHALYVLICCLSLALAGDCLQAGSIPKHGLEGNAAASALPRHEELSPNTRTNDVGSYHIYYVQPRAKAPASIVISMHLDAYQDIKGGKGSFQKFTPQGKVRVKWLRKWGMLHDTYGRNVSTEFGVVPVYTLTIDSPKAIPIQLETQQHELYAMYLNGGLISKDAYFSGLSGKVNFSGDYDDQRFRHVFPGGHNVVILQTQLFWIE